jgi:hypothetical protein
VVLGKLGDAFDQLLPLLTTCSAQFGYDIRRKQKFIVSIHEKIISGQMMKKKISAEYVHCRG